MTSVEHTLVHQAPPGWSEQDFAINLFVEGDNCVAHVTGDLDLVARNRMFTACTAGNHSTMVVDMSRLHFMDCSGYGSIVAARGVVEADSRALEIRGAKGQPAALLGMLAAAAGE